MTTPHKATPEQWADAGAFASDTRACLLELRDRIAAAEQLISELQTCHNTTADAIQALESNHPAKPDSSPAPAGGLVERVAGAIHPSVCADPNLYLHDARAAILAVAEWLEKQNVGAGRAAARWLREEVERG